jgi:hypothetical protein
VAVSVRPSLVTSSAGRASEAVNPPSRPGEPGNRAVTGEPADAHLADDRHREDHEPARRPLRDTARVPRTVDKMW